MNDNWLARTLNNNDARHQDHRSPFQRDRARILHSAAFRRLQAKTQVMGLGISDFYRTRLTHSLEASQIGTGICAQLRQKYPDLCHQLILNDDALIEAICLGHDIGHPPFGHGGEIALNYMMRDFGGFEGNGQTFRIVTQLEKYTELNGMNLSRRTLLGLLKYPQIIDKLNNPQGSIPNNFRQLKADEWHPPKGLYLDDIEMLNWVLAPLSNTDKKLFQQVSVNKNQHHKTLFKSFDCSIMELADDIAYGIHDMEDAIVTKVVDKDIFIKTVVNPLQQSENVWIRQNIESIANKLFSNKHYLQKDAIGSLVNFLIVNIELIDLNKQQHLHFEESLLRFNAKLPEPIHQVLETFKRFVFTFVINKTEIQRLGYKGQQIVMELFEAFASDPIRLLPDSTCKRWLKATQNDNNPHRVIADYISGMTDEFAKKTYQNLFLSI